MDKKTKRSGISQELFFVIKIMVITITLCVLYYVIMIIHEHFWKSDIIFYSYIKVAFVFIILSSICILIVQKVVPYFRKIITISNMILSYICFILVTYSINMTFPVTVDRSFSVFILASLAKDDPPTSIDAADLEIIVRNYFYGQDLLDKRIHEQLVTGSIIAENGVITLTKKGQLIVFINKIMGKIFNLDVKNFAPE